MTDSPFQALGLKAVINASGKMTALGGTAQTPAVAEAQTHAAQHHVELAALRGAAGSVIAERTGAEAGCVTTGAAAGIAIGVAAMICGRDMTLVRQIPAPETKRREILLQSPHNVNFGARVEQMIRVGGGVPRLIEPSKDALREALSSATAGMVHVQSHHVRGDALPLEAVVTALHGLDLPVLVDAAAEEDLTLYIRAGADLVTYSGGKAIGGPTSGFIAGKADLIAACELQDHGLARTMKVGKEQIAGLLTALAAFPGGDEAKVRLQALHDRLTAIPGLDVGIEPDLAGREIERVAIRSEDVDWLEGLVRFLRDGEPAIHTRHHHVHDGVLLLDVREVKAEHVPIIAERIRSFVQTQKSPA